MAVLADQQIVALGSVQDIAQATHQFIANFFQGERGKRALEAIKGMGLDAPPTAPQAAAATTTQGT